MPIPDECADAVRRSSVPSESSNIQAVDESVIPDSAELSWFQENRNEYAKMCDGYCTQLFQRALYANAC